MGGCADVAESRHVQALKREWGHQSPGFDPRVAALRPRTRIPTVTEVPSLTDHYADISRPLESITHPEWPFWTPEQREWLRKHYALAVVSDTRIRDMRSGLRDTSPWTLEQRAYAVLIPLMTFFAGLAILLAAA